MVDLYKCLDVNKDANETDIKKAYKKMAMKHHPDRKTGSEEKFKEITEAYEILSDSNKRSMYDKFGYDSIKDGGGPGGPGGPNVSPFDIFNSMFSQDSGIAEMMGGMGRGMGGFQNFQTNMFDMSDIMGGAMNNPLSDMLNNKYRDNNNNNKIIKVNITLDELYTGTTKLIKVNKRNKCKKCNGIGHDKKDEIVCGDCNGEKMINKRIEIRPDLYQTSSYPCNSCKMNGYILKTECECSNCSGKGYTIKESKYNLKINKGNIDGKEIILKGKGDYIPEINKTGNLIIQLNELNHNKYQRLNNDLYIEENITLIESLCMDYYKLEYLNNQDIYIKIDKLLDPNYIMIIENKGMPLLVENENDIVYGNLLIKFKIKYPYNLDNEKKIKIKEILGYENKIDVEDSDTFKMNKYRLIDEEDTREDENVQCMQQ